MILDVRHGPDGRLTVGAVYISSTAILVKANRLSGQSANSPGNLGASPSATHCRYGE